MTPEQKKRIEAWLKKGTFEDGLALFREVSPQRNYYINNIARRGAATGHKTLVYELSKLVLKKPIVTSGGNAVKKKPFPPAISIRGQLPELDKLSHQLKRLKAWLTRLFCAKGSRF